MPKPSRTTKTAPVKRGQGRPVSGKNDVGRERLLAVTERLLRSLPPARVTISRIAREASADPALIRYYFGDRTRLLLAVADRVTANAPHGAAETDDPPAALTDHIGSTVQFVRRASFMHRLMIDELAQAGTDESRARVTEMNVELVDFYRRVLAKDAGAELRALDPLFLHLVVLGASDFFSTAEPLVSQLVPEGTDMEKVTADFRVFLIDLIMNGVRTR